MRHDVQSVIDGWRDGGAARRGIEMHGGDAEALGHPAAEVFGELRERKNKS